MAAGFIPRLRGQSRVLAVLGSLLLLADFIVTGGDGVDGGWDELFRRAAASIWKLATIGCIVLVGAINYFGPKHSGSFAVTLAVPMVVMVIAIIALSVPHLSYHPGIAAS